MRAPLRLGGALLALTGREAGTNPTYLPDLLLAELFIEPASGQPLDQAIRDTFRP